MTDSPARLKITQDKNVNIVEFLQNKILDELNIAEIGQELQALIVGKDRPRLLLDFANVEHLSSAALGVLINVNKWIKEHNGQLRLANIKPQILEVFMITKLNRLFRILPGRTEAMASFE